MASVVIAHAPEDTLPARALAQKIAYMGLQPIIELPPGEALRTAMRDAAAAMVLWSPNSVGVADLILDVARTPKIIHARMQAATTPHEFSTEPTVDLTGWRGEDDFPGWKELAKVIATAAGIKSPAAGPRPPSGFFQPGAPPKQPSPQAPRAAPTPAAAPRAAAPAPAQAPPQRAAQAAPLAPEMRRAPDPPRLEPEKSGPNLALIGVVTFVLVAGLGGGGYWYMSQQGANHSLAAAWDDIDINDPSALRDFIARSNGALRAEAEQALTVLEDAEFDAAMDSDTTEAFEGFLANFPDSQYAVRARGRIAELRDGQTGIEGAEDGVEIDPETGLPIVPDEDLLPPGSLETPEEPDEPDDASPFTPAPESGGPTPLNPAPAPAPTQPVEPPRDEPIN